MKQSTQLPNSAFALMPDPSQTALPVSNETWPTTADGQLDLNRVAIRSFLRESLYSQVRKLRRLGVDVRCVTYTVTAPDDEAGGNINVAEV